MHSSCTWPCSISDGLSDGVQGLLVAVERMRYPSLEAGIAYTVKIYIATLKILARERKFKVMVHPVPPVLNETRHIVKAFNAQVSAHTWSHAHIPFICR